MIPTLNKPEEQQSTAQSVPPAEPPAAPTGPGMSDMEALPIAPTAMPPAMAPTPPRGTIRDRIQRMSPGWRWTLGLGLAFVAGLAWWLVAVLGPGLSGVGSLQGPVPLLLTFIVMAVLGVAAAFVLGSWWAVLPMGIATAAGLGVRALWSSQGGTAGDTGVWGWFLVMLAAVLLVEVIGTAVSTRRARR